MKSKLSIMIAAVAAFAALFTGASAAFAYQNPGQPLGLVNDYANLLSQDEKTYLETKLSVFNVETGSQFAVATISTLGGDSIENFAEKLFKDWGIGQKKADNGILLLVSKEEREVRIEVGYGLEPTVTDAASSMIIRDTIIPNFKEGKYFAGIDGAVGEITGLVKGDPEAMKYKTGSSGERPQFNYFYLVFIFFAFGINILAYMARTKSWWLGGVFGLVLGAVFIGAIGAAVCAVIGLAVDFVLSKWGSNWFPKGPRGPRGPWIMGGPGFGGRGGSGFGGFGGGSSGGGGASGRW